MELPVKGQALIYRYFSCQRFCMIKLFLDTCTTFGTRYCLCFVQTYSNFLFSSYRIWISCKYVIGLFFFWEKNLFLNRLLCGCPKSHKLWSCGRHSILVEVQCLGNLKIKKIDNIMHLEEVCRRKRIKLINRGKCVKLIEISKNY